MMLDFLIVPQISWNQTACEEPKLNQKYRYAPSRFRSAATQQYELIVCNPYKKRADKDHKRKRYASTNQQIQKPFFDQNLSGSDHYYSIKKPKIPVNMKKASGNLFNRWHE
jgi:hypothetical protein